jgi:hypothetical protein
LMLPTTPTGVDNKGLKVPLDIFGLLHIDVNGFETLTHL